MNAGDVAIWKFFFLPTLSQRIFNRNGCLRCERVVCDVCVKKLQKEGIFIFLVD